MPQEAQPYTLDNVFARIEEKRLLEEGIIGASPKIEIYPAAKNIDGKLYIGEALFFIFPLKSLLSCKKLDQFLAWFCSAREGKVGLDSLAAGAETAESFVTSGYGGSIREVYLPQWSAPVQAGNMDTTVTVHSKEISKYLKQAGFSVKVGVDTETGTLRIEHPVYFRVSIMATPNEKIAEAILHGQVPLQGSDEDNQYVHRTDLVRHLNLRERLRFRMSNLN